VEDQELQLRAQEELSAERQVLLRRLQLVRELASPSCARATESQRNFRFAHVPPCAWWVMVWLVAGRRFIGFYTDGDNDESRGYFSIYLFLDVNHMPKGKAVTIEYFLTFINHKDSDETVKKGSFK
jgi:hypothetical protein